MVLKQMGGGVTGTGGSDASQQFPIEKVEVAGDTITFQVTFGPTAHFQLHPDADGLVGVVRIEAPGGAIQEGAVTLKRK
jgi:hypothetical protein